MLSNVYNATYVPMTFLAMYMFNKMTIDWPIRVASILFLAGAWVRSLFVFGNSFWPLMIGQTLISCSFPMFACAITLIANKWFSDTEREIVVSMCGIAIPAGNLIAFIWTGLAFRSSPEGDELFSTLRTMLFNNNLLITAITVPMLLFIREKPKFPPSLVATRAPKERNFLPQAKEAVRDRNFIVLVFIFMMVNGSFVASGTNISNIYASKKMHGGAFGPS
jgi:hypothetical protein